MTLIDEEEAELDQYLNEDPYYDEELEKKPVTVEAKIEVDSPGEPMFEELEETKESSVKATAPKDEEIDQTKFTDEEKAIYEKILKQ